MKSFESVIYIPPLGNSRKWLKPAFWGPHGLYLESHLINWEGTDFDQRLEGVGNRLEQLSKLGRVSLLGVSGSTSAALNLYARHPESVHRLVSVCGKIHRPERIGQSIFDRYPNYEKSMAILPASLEAIDDEMVQRIRCIRPNSDGVVAPEDAVLEGAEEYIIQTDGHLEGIDSALTIGSGDIAEFFRRD